MTAQDRFTIDLDSLEREGAPEPFTVKLGEKVYVFADAMDVDWQELMTSLTGNMVHFFHLVMPNDEAKEFLAQKLPTWKMRKLMELYTEHHGLTDPGNRPASSTS